MKKITFLLAMMLVTFTACHNEDFEEISLESKREKISYEVTPEEAVSRLGMFLSNNGTRASLNDVTIKTLMKSDFVPATRSSDAEDAPAIYLIDIPDGGCAVMGADKRLEPVYAIMDETKLSPEDLTTATATRTESADEEDIQTFVTGLINNAVEADLMGVFPYPDSIFIRDPTRKEINWTDTVIVQQVPPLLDTKWCQTAPFNNNYRLCSGGERKKAGCGIIAAAQIMYYHKQPSVLSGTAFNWDLLRFYEVGYSNQPMAATIEVANYISKIAIAAGVNINDYVVETGVDFSQITSLFNSTGYNNAMFTTYSFNTIKTMLGQNLPVFISAYESNGGASHMWVIDGSYLYKIEHWVRESYYVGPGWDYNEYISSTDYYNLFHCNYGFEGRCDGYYNSAVFNTNVELPDGYIDVGAGDTEGTPQGNFSSNLHIMSYQK